ncbi:MAG: hypothetical protein AAF251_13110 [Pseudomonadota bacterium]
MEFSKLEARQQVWDIREFFSGLGNIMLAGGVALPIWVMQSSGYDLALWKVILGFTCASLTGLLGLAALWRFVDTSIKPATAAFLAIGAAFSGLLCGGLFGYMAVTIIRSWLQ